jgi:two-component system phosphate regulon sensor histidine kinase PhoR
MAMSFRTKLLASHVGLVVAVGMIAIFTLNRWLTDDLVRQLDTRLLEQAKGAIEWAEEGGRRHPERVATRIAHIVDAEVALFDRDGTVIGASPPETRTDLGDEIRDARASGVGIATRLRGGQEIHYVAVRGADGIVIRLSVPLSEVSDTVGAMRSRLLVTSGVAILVALALGLFASRVTSRPLGQMTETATRLARGDFDVPIEAGGEDDFGVLWRALKSLAQQLKARIGELVTERDHLSAILTGMIEGVLVIDHGGKVIVANPAVEKLLGGPSSVVGMSVGEAVPHDDIREPIERCRRGEETETELELTDERGSSIAIYVRPLPATAGGAVVAVLRDQTALRRLTRVRRDFVANVSHELRTPVTAIQGYAETLLRNKTDAETAKQFLEVIHRQALRIGGLVEQLLALSELEARDRDDIAHENVELVSVARHVAEAVRGRAEQRHMTVTLDIASDAVAFADREGLERALLNLVDNAIKYGVEGGEVKIASVREGSSVKVTVSDDGPGIDSKHLPRLFERFYRVDPGRSRSHGGAGLGLSIVRHLVESMDGSIDVTSDVGKGARFVLTLPAH